MKIILEKRIPLFLFALGIILFAASSAMSADVPRMTVEELNGLLGNDNVSVLDARAGRDWNSSEFKIKGAGRTPSGDIESWVNTYPKDNILVVYCA